MTRSIRYVRRLHHARHEIYEYQRAQRDEWAVWALVVWGLVLVAVLGLVLMNAERIS